MLNNIKRRHLQISLFLNLIYKSQNVECVEIAGKYRQNSHLSYINFISSSIFLLLHLTIPLSPDLQVHHSQDCGAMYNFLLPKCHCVPVNPTKWHTYEKLMCSSWHRTNTVASFLSTYLLAQLRYIRCRCRKRSTILYLKN